MDNNDDNDHWYVIDLYDTRFDNVINLGGTSTRAEMTKLFNYFLKKYRKYNRVVVSIE